MKYVIGEDEIEQGNQSLCGWSGDSILDVSMRIEDGLNYG
jgi:hypothetical protein